MTNNLLPIPDFIQVAKRENNSKRVHLYVNQLQGKHIPVSPSAALQLFAALADCIETRYAGERLLVIGFAETATAIGASIAYQASNVKFHLSTTREQIAGAEFLFFTESHSHATDQRLAINDFAQYLPEIDRIVFAEDEVSTGNTIEKIMNLLRQEFPDEMKKFGIISILNSMSRERIEEFAEKEISCDYLYRIPPLYGMENIANLSYESLSNITWKKSSLSIPSIEIGTAWTGRLISDISMMKAACNQFVAAAIKQLPKIDGHCTILILGTEEFMFPGLLLGRQLEKEIPDADVKFQATTRSPIEICREPAYPLRTRVTLDSLYEEGRVTYLYNLKKYDFIFIVTDASPINQRGLHTLVGALEHYGNKHIGLIKWGGAGNEK